MTTYVAPIEQSSQSEYRQARGFRDPAQSHIAFVEDRKLLAEEQIFGDECGANAKKQTNEREQSSDLTKARYN
jgi:hypothetical protein